MKQFATRLGRVNLNRKLSHAGAETLVLRADEVASLLKPFGVQGGKHHVGR